MKESRDHRLGKQDFREFARHPAEAVREAEVQAVESRPAGQRPPADERKAFAAPGAGRKAEERAEGTAL